MSDLERARVIDADPDGSLRVSTTQHGLRIEYRRSNGAQCQVSIPWSEMDRHRGIPLTLEAVQTVILDVANEHGQPPGYPSHLHFAMDVLARLRQQMGGLDHD